MSPDCYIRPRLSRLSPPLKKIIQPSTSHFNKQLGSRNPGNKDSNLITFNNKIPEISSFSILLTLKFSFS